LKNTGTNPSPNLNFNRNETLTTKLKNTAVSGN